MDFSAKHLKRTLTESQNSVEKRTVVKRKPVSGIQKLHGNPQSAEAKAFIKSNAAHMYKSALEQRTHCELNPVGYISKTWTHTAISKWWDNVDIVQSLHDRGFTLVDDHPNHFGTWYSPIAVLEAHEVSELENFLTSRLSQATRPRPKVAVQEILKTYFPSNDSCINTLRLLLLFNKLWLLDGFAFGDTFDVINKILPLKLGHYYVDMDGRTENFSVSWRYPKERVNPSDGVSAAILSWLCSKAGNEQFRSFYEVIKFNMIRRNICVRSKIETSHEGFIVFLDKNLKNISLELSPDQLKSLLESLDYEVVIGNKSTPHYFSIRV
jgi:hypothetical protein